MSMGYGAYLEKALEDGMTVLFYYSCGNVNEGLEHYNAMMDKHDGEIIIDKTCFVEPEIHVKVKKSPSGRKKTFEKRILVEVPYEKYIEEGLIRIKNASGCWKVNNGVDIMALKLIFKLFNMYQEEGKIPDKISWFS